MLMFTDLDHTQGRNTEFAVRHKLFFTADIFSELIFIAFHLLPFGILEYEYPGVYLLCISSESHFKNISYNLAMARETFNHGGNSIFSRILV